MGGCLYIKRVTLIGLVYTKCQLIGLEYLQRGGRDYFRELERESCMNKSVNTGCNEEPT